jgi:hypothetical protein
VADPTAVGTEDERRQRREGRIDEIMPGARVTGWGIAVPDKIVTNADLSLRLDTSDEWITERTGIKERHIGGTTSGLAVEAGRVALARAGVAPEDVERRLSVEEEIERRTTQDHTDTPHFRKDVE